MQDETLPHRRATTVGEMKEAMLRLFSRESFQYGMKLQARPSDVFISPYAKCGTTLMQQIVHGLRTRGDMTFGEITEVAPCLEFARDLGIDLDAPQRTRPRVFKSHFPYTAIPKGGRYIYLTRDPGNAAVSMYHFFEGWIFEPGSIDINSFVQRFYLPSQRPTDIWNHLVSWWPKRSAPDTLMMTYEDVVADLPAAVRRTGEFLGLPDDGGRYEIATRQASIDFMRDHGSKFDDHLVPQARNSAAGLPPDAGSTKVRSGKSSGKDALDDSSRTAMAEAWRKIVEPATGMASYGELREELGRVLGNAG